MAVDIIEKARVFSTAAHAAVTQKRKYTDENYIVDPAAVVEIVRSVPHKEHMLAASWLHDVVEDAGVTLDQIEEESGSVYRLVSDLTDVSKPSEGNRVKRKESDRNHIKQTSRQAKTIKLADLIDNTRSRNTPQPCQSRP